MDDEPLVVSVVQVGRGHHAVCSTHGSIAVWMDPTMAAFACMGHAAAHHRRTT